MVEAFPFWKMEGCGNDFVVVDRADLPEDTGPEIAPRLCDRRFGVGADGVLVIDERDLSDGAFARMHVWNADGSVAEMCGNGLRCVVRWLIEQGRCRADRGVIDSGAGPVPFSVDGAEVVVELGRPVLPDRGPIAVEGVRGVRVELGNPHFVVFEEDQPEEDLLVWGPRLEVSGAFPHRSNVEAVTVVEPGLLRLRVWERGVGETLACGSGACAAAVAARASGRVDTDAVRLILPGGPLGVDWTGSARDPVALRGPARTVFEGTWRSNG